jgi:hypothetical protein
MQTCSAVGLAVAVYILTTENAFATAKRSTSALNSTNNFMTHSSLQLLYLYGTTDLVNRNVSVGPWICLHFVDVHTLSCWATHWKLYRDQD